MKVISSSQEFNYKITQTDITQLYDIYTWSQIWLKLIYTNTDGDLW